MSYQFLVELIDLTEGLSYICLLGKKNLEVKLVITRESTPRNHSAEVCLYPSILMVLVILQARRTAIPSVFITTPHTRLHVSRPHHMTGNRLSRTKGLCLTETANLATSHVVDNYKKVKNSNEPSNRAVLLLLLLL